MMWCNFTWEWRKSSTICTKENICDDTTGNFNLQLKEKHLRYGRWDLDWKRYFWIYRTKEVGASDKCIIWRRRSTTAAEEEEHQVTILHYTLKTQTVENVSPYPFKKEIQNLDSNSNFIFLDEVWICLLYGWGYTFSTVWVFNV